MTLGRKDVFLAGFAGFVAWGFAVRWLPALRWLGYAFVAGILTALIALLWIMLTTSKTRSRADSELCIRDASMRFLSSTQWTAEFDRFRASRIYQPVQLYPQSFVISEALDALLRLAMGSFVSSWYDSITEDPTFVNEVDRGMRSALCEIRDRVLNADIVSIAVSRIVPLITAHVREFDQAERIVRGRSLNRNVTESEELNLAIAGRYRDGKLHQAASLAYSDTKLTQQAHLRKLLVRILPDILPHSMLRSRAVLILVKEIVACAILFPIIER